MNKFSDLLGKTIIKIDQVNQYGEEIIFHLSDETKAKLYHSQDCCESVRVEEIIGDLADLLNSPLMEAEESIGDNIQENDNLNYGSTTWTFYRLRTAKGSVVLRWKGESNGYYSESVSFEEIK